MIPEYPKIHSSGHRDNRDVFDGPVVIQEKYDGSQFSFGTVGGQLYCRSKGQALNNAEPGMFRAAVDTSCHLAFEGKLVDGCIYRCEFLAKPKHNVLTYSRIPAGQLVLWDIQLPSGSFVFDTGAVAAVALNLGIEPAAVLYEGDGGSLLNNWENESTHLFERESSLGGPKIEGFVVKNYRRKQVAKFVSAAFKEKHAHCPKNPRVGGDEVAAIVNSLRTEARWLKAIQHLREKNVLVNGPEDIGPLMRELSTDLHAEEEQWIKDRLFDVFWKSIQKGVSQGFPDYYKKLLANGPSVWQELGNSPFVQIAEVKI
jgi:hypothetical protein